MYMHLFILKKNNGRINLKIKTQLTEHTKLPFICKKNQFPEIQSCINLFTDFVYLTKMRRVSETNDNWLLIRLYYNVSEINIISK